MYATWPIVVSALVAGLVGGFLIPDRPQSQPAAVAKVSPVPELGESDTSSRLANGPAPENNHTLVAPKDQASATSTRDAIDPQPSPCAIDSWPYRAPGCLDRTAAVEPKYSVIDVKRVDPAQSLVAEGDSADDSAAKSRQKVVSAPSGRAEEADDTKRDSSNEATGTTGAAKAKSRPQERPERLARPAGRGSAEIRYGRDDPRVVIRGPDGRLYLAPRYRHVPPPGYYIR
jgi:hypothetical protein